MRHLSCLLGLVAATECFDQATCGGGDSLFFPGSLSEKKTAFLAEFHGYNPHIEQMRQADAPRLNVSVYLDYAGSGQYLDSQVWSNYDDLVSHAYGNAHSHNPSAELTDSRLTEVREKILKWFDALDDYTVIFTSGATAALKLVGETFNFDGGKFWYTRTNHNSVLGIRELAVQSGATFRSLRREEVDRILAERRRRGKSNGSGHVPKCLFAYPLKDNFAGDVWPAEWPSAIREVGLTDDCHWMVAADAAAYVTTSPLSLKDLPVDFAALSFYKMFGYPTGLGCLIVRKGREDEMRKLYFGGGTVVTADCDSRWCKMKGDASARFEDGTVSFLSVNALRFGFKALERAGGMRRVNEHIASLTRYLCRELDSIMFFGSPAVTRYAHDWPALSENGIVAFNVHRRDGSVVNFTQIEMMAAHNDIHLRGGCFCNPGACQDFLGLTVDELRSASETRESCADPTNTLGKPLGAVRVSLGYLTTFEDVERFLDFVRAAVN